MTNPIFPYQSIDDCIAETEEGLQPGLSERQKQFLQQVAEQNQRIFEQYKAQLMQSLQAQQQGKTERMQALVSQVKEATSFEAVENLLEPLANQIETLKKTTSIQQHDIAQAEQNLHIRQEQQEALTVTIQNLSIALKHSGPKQEIQNFLNACGNDAINNRLEKKSHEPHSIPHYPNNKPGYLGDRRFSPSPSGNQSATRDFK